MQILASALPGFRDLRAPLGAGYSWILFVYLLVQPDITTRPSNELAGAAYDLASAVGPIWVGIACGLAAYVIGSVSLVVTGWLVPLADLFPFWVRFTGQISSTGIIEQRERLSDGRIEDMLGAGAAMALRDTIDRRFSSASRQLSDEASLPATLLVGDKPHLYAEVDRLRSEGDFRLAVSMPLLALLVLTSAEASPSWGLIAPGIFILAIQGMNRRTESRQVILDAIERGAVDSSTIQRLTTWVDGLLQLGDIDPSEREDAIASFVTRN